ncbi:unnamed protein product [Alopecurus aequalis]
MQTPCDYQLAVADWERRLAMEPTIWVPGLPLEMAVSAPASDSVVVSSGERQQLKLAEESSCHQYAVEVFKQAAQSFKDKHDQMEMKIQLFPPSMDDLAAQYAVPKVVSIGPYHHGRTPALQQMESTKHVAAWHFINDSGCSVEEVDCFGDDGTTVDLDPTLKSAFSSKELQIFSDIVLLENQLPWVVVEKLRSFMPNPVDMGTFIGQVKLSLQARQDIYFDPPEMDSTYTPPHLLGLLRYYIVSSTHNSATTLSDKAKKVSLSVSVIELAEMGIELTATKAKAELKEMGVKRKPFTGELFLAPLSLNDANAGFLVNMAAFELCMTPDFAEADDTLSTVCSYLCLLGMVTDSEGDMQALRNKHILQGGGGLTNNDALKLFTSLEKHLRPGNCYYNTIVDIENYRTDRRIWIKIYEFGYKNLRIIVAVGTTIVGLVSFLATLKSPK